jgi:hypothetical protein
MTKLTSLLIGSGDSFLIENEGENYLIDSGGNQKLILNLIPTKIHLAICTHNDSDHCNGFIGILKSKKHSIDEIWLPGIWATVIDFVKKWTYNTQFSREQLDNINLENINLNEILTDTDESIDDLTDELGFLSDIDNFPYWRFFFNHSIINSKIHFNINRILQIAKLAYDKGVAIKWFFPDSNGDSLINNFRPVNCKHLLRMKRIRNNNLNFFYQLAYLTSENEHSLVFEYYIDKLPRILFTADSIISIANPYTSQIIVTAPHHGSHSNRQVYSTIKGTDLIWIRSDRPSFTRPCQDFLHLKKKYCLSCTKKHPIQREEIIFEYDKGQWKYLKGQLCNC